MPLISVRVRHSEVTTCVLVLTFPRSGVVPAPSNASSTCSCERSGPGLNSARVFPSGRDVNVPSLRVVAEPTLSAPFDPFYPCVCFQCAFPLKRQHPLVGRTLVCPAFHLRPLGMSLGERSALLLSLPGLSARAALCFWRMLCHGHASKRNVKSIGARNPSSRSCSRLLLSGDICGSSPRKTSVGGYLLHLLSIDYRRFSLIDSGLVPLR